MGRGSWDIKKSCLLLPPLLLCLFLTACGAEQAEQERPLSYKVSLVDSLFFSAEGTTAEIEAGEDYSVLLRFADGYDFSSCDYPDYTAEPQEDGVLLLCRNVERPCRITVRAAEREAPEERPVIRCAIRYRFNGGRLPGSGASERTEEYELSYHLRPNTWNGGSLTREGYTLTGWNTRADGTGDHIGLGSRVTCGEGETLTLYAQWTAWIDGDLFVYRQQSDGTLALIGYRGPGDEDPFVIPEEINGRSVTAVEGSFTTGMACGALTGTTLVLPKTVTVVEKNAFSNAAFSHICFFDTLRQVYENSFARQIRTWHLNAATPPYFQKLNNNARFADDMDRLILHAEERKLLFFAGCSFSYGLQSPRMEEQFGARYTILNMGVIGGINAAFQMECMLPYLREGDVFVHAPEEMSPCQLMVSRHADGRLFILTEGNYDLLALADFSGTYGIWEAYMNYVELREEAEPGAYTDAPASYNRYGDIILSRPYDEAEEFARDVSYSDNAYYFNADLLTEQSAASLAALYDRLRAAGARVLVSFAPINEQASADGKTAEDGRAFEARLRELLAPYGYDVISHVEDYILPGRYFYDSDYHLNSFGARLRTEQLAQDLLQAGVSGS